MQNIKYYIKDFIKSDPFVIFLIVVIFSGLRAIPEMRIGQYPIGFDTINSYSLVYFNDTSLFQSVQGSVLVQWIMHYFLQDSPIETIWLSIKMWGILLYGGLTASLFCYFYFGQKLSKIQSLIITFIFGLSLASLRMSMELFRNEAGLIFMFLSLMALENISAKLNLKNLLLFCLWSILLVVIFSLHQLAFILTIIILVSKIVNYLFGVKNKPINYLVFLIFFALLAMAGEIFSETVVMNFGVWRNYSISDITGSTPYPIESGIVTNFYLFLYSGLIFFSTVGLMVKRSSYLSITLIILSILSLSPAIFYGYGFYLWDRWMYFLIIPFAYYAYFGLEYLVEKMSVWFDIRNTGILWAIGILLMVWKPVAFLQSGENSLLNGIKLPYEEMSDYFPASLADNSLQKFNEEINNKFVELFNRYNQENNTAVIDHSISGYMKIKGLNAPVTEAFYGHLPESQKTNLLTGGKTFYTINDTFGLKGWVEEKTIGDIQVYKFTSKQIH